MGFTIKIFEVESLGYYSAGVKQSNMGDMLSLLNDWNDWEEEIFPKELDNLKDELTDIQMLSSEYYIGKEYETSHGSLIGLWKGLSDGTYKKPALDIDNNSSDKFVIKNHDTSKIPGKQYFYWFLPDDNLVVTISPQNPLLARTIIHKSFMGFLKNKSKYRVLDSENKIIGYSISGNHTVGCESVKPEFNLKQKIFEKKKEIEKILIRDMRSIKAVIIKKQNSNKSSKGLGFYEYEGDIEIRTEVNPGFSDNDLKQKIEDLYKLKESDEDVLDVGFQYNNQRKVMLSGIESYMNIDLGIEANEMGVIDQGKLFEILISRKDELLSNMGSLKVLRGSK